MPILNMYKMYKPSEHRTDNICGIHVYLWNTRALQITYIIDLSCVHWEGIKNADNRFLPPWTFKIQGHFKVFPRSKILIFKVHLLDVTAKLVLNLWEVSPIAQGLGNDNCKNTGFTKSCQYCMSQASCDSMVKHFFYRFNHFSRLGLKFQTFSRLEFLFENFILFSRFSRQAGILYKAEC